MKTLKMILYKNKLNLINILILIITFLYIFIDNLFIYELFYEYDKVHDTYLISGAKGIFDKLVIPSTHNNKKVSGIKRKAFYNKDIKVLEFDEFCNIKKIEPLAFYNTKINSIDFPDSVEVIENNAFLNNRYLKSIRFNKDTSKLNSINASAFFDCINLENVELPKNLKIIYDYAFYNTKLIVLYVYKRTNVILNDNYLKVEIIE